MPNVSSFWSRELFPSVIRPLFCSVWTLACWFLAVAGAGAQEAKWEAGNATELAGLRVTLSRPVLVGRSKGFLWFPSLIRLSNGDLLALMSNYADEHTTTSTASAAWSTDGGLTWSPLRPALYGDGALTLPSGEELLMPYYLRPLGEGVMGAPYQLCTPGRQELKAEGPGITISGWPRPDRSFDPKLGLSGFVCNGQVVPLKAGGYLATLYGYFAGTTRYSLVASESSDGVSWKIRSVVADEKCELEGKEGPCESALCRLADGRLLCVFRLDSGKPYGQSYSSDEGRTWTKPAAMSGVFSVQPSLAVLPNGMLALSGGRPGLFLWICTDCRGESWQTIDVLANHNQFQSAEAIRGPGNTSSYTEVVVLDETHLLYIYDRIPHGWSRIPQDLTETNSIWVVRVTVSENR